jgi:murein DD-endopeptidase MepM/ murein hydrolase activator NlpD
MWRAHKGVDYAAPEGTPVRATADAKVTFAGTQNGYGNVIELQHGGAFSTLYAHLSRLAPDIRQGARVAQGDVIGTWDRPAGQRGRICITSFA